MLANRKGCAWYDLDQLVLNYPAANHYPTVRDLFIAEGVERLRELEAEAVKSVLKRFNPGTKAAVISLGGGTIENEEAMAMLREEASIVYLYLPEKLLYQRVMAGGRPPFISEENPEKDFHEMYLKRDRLNREQADLVIDLDEATPEENVQIIWDFLNKAD